MTGDSESSRTCGSCGETKELSEFYRDGTNSHGEPKYRRDCKKCYKGTRISEQVAKHKEGK